MTDRKRLILLAGSVALLAFLLYLPAAGNEFLEWDDGAYVVDNPHLAPLDGRLLRWALFSFHSANWHPLTWFSHALDLAVWGLNPVGHHLTNLLLHALNSALVVLVVTRLVSAWRERNSRQLSPSAGWEGIVAAGVTGLLFAVHPLHVESVAWVAERKDLLCGLFFLLAVLEYLNKGTRRFCLPLFILALMSKPMALTLPVVLLLLDWYPLGHLDNARDLRRALLEKLPFFVLAAGSAIITVLAQRSGGAVSTLEAVPLYARAAVAAKALALYLGKILLPVGLSPYYPYPSGKELFSPASFATMAVAVAIAVACMALRRRTRLYAAIFGYYLVTLLPVLGLVQIGRQSMADRYTYLPGLGPLLLVGIGASWLVSRRGWQAGKVAAVASIAATLLAVATVRQIPLWHDSITLWTRVIEGGGTRLDFAYNNRGVAWHRQGDLARAEADFGKAIAINRLDPDYYSNRGTTYMKLNRSDNALADFLKAMAIDPAKPGPYYNTACIFSLRNDTDAACYWLGRSISHGYDRWEHMSTDSDLENLRATSCYRTLLEKKPPTGQ